MQTKPHDNWFWYFDPQYDRLMIDMGEQLFRSRYCAKQLTPEAFNQQPFSVEDASDYFCYEDKCQHLIDLSVQQRIELVLNALAAKRFLKPLMPKSWYFHYQAKQLTHPLQLSDCVQVQLANDRSVATLLVAEVGEIASLCLVAQPGLALADKQLLLGDAIKVMHDRLLLLPTDNLFYQQVV